MTAPSVRLPQASDTDAPSALPAAATTPVVTRPAGPQSAQRPVFVTDALQSEPTEGCQVIAGELARHLREQHDATVLGPRNSTLPGTVPVLRGRLLGGKALREVQRLRPSHLIYLPSQHLTFASLMRAALLWFSARGAALDFVVLQQHCDPPRRLISRLPWRFVVATGQQASSIETIGGRVGLLSPRVERRRISRETPREQARRELGLPVAGPVFLHVGHARSGRNLGALTPLCQRATVVLILSDFGEEDDAALPAGPGLRVIRGFVRDISLYYRAATAYLFPTYDSLGVIGVPVSVFEALANGTPVVARRSDALQRWEHLPGLELVDSDAQLAERARHVSDFGGDVVTDFDVSANCLGDLSPCLPEAPTGGCTIIAVSGPDGSGKTTFTHALELTLRQLHPDRTVSRLWLRWNPRPFAPRTSRTPVSTVDHRHRGHPLKRALKAMGLRRAWKHLAIRSYRRQLALQLAALDDDAIVIADRYVADFVVDLMAAGVIRAPEVESILDAFPRPTTTILLEVPDEVLLARRMPSEDPTKALDRARLFSSLAPIASAVKIDGRHPSAVKQALEAAGLSRSVE